MVGAATVPGTDGVEYGILGPLVLSHGGRAVQIGAPKQRSLLLCLLLRRNEAVSTDRLIEALWPEWPPVTAAKLVQLYVSKLRTSLPGHVLETQSPGYLLRVSPDELDSSCFERLLAEGRAGLATGNARLAAALLRRALALWRGPALGDAAYADFAASEAARLEELRLECLEERIAADLALGRHEEVLAELTALVREHPLRERLRTHLMLAHYRADRQADALAAFREGRRIFRDELGLEPGEELRSLERAILLQDPELAWRGAAGDRGTRLPHPPTPLIGRERELAELRALVERPEARLVSLVGAGGSGKTRLALALGHACTEAFANGVVFAELAALRDPGLVVPTLARACGLGESGGDLLERLEARLADRELLLIVDNLEHLPAAGEILAALVTAAPRLKIVATSRAVLHLSGEHVYPVQPLAENEAVALFLARARALEPRFELAPDGEPIVREICRHLDGLPLAIELAAAQTRTLGPVALLQRLGSRLQLLAGGPRDLPARQRTLRDTLAWSTDLFSAAERRDLARLGVFAGGWTLEAAERICAVSLARLTALVDHSLVQRVPGPGEQRFTMLETVHEYALALLERSQPQVEVRHASFFAEEAVRTAQGFYGAEPAEAVAWFDAEHDNVRRALDVLRRERRPEETLKLADAAALYWSTRGHISEGRSRLAAILSESSNVDHPARADALRAAAVLAAKQQDDKASRRLADEARALASTMGDARGEASALNVLGYAAAARGDLAEAERNYRRAASSPSAAATSGAADRRS